MLLKKLIGLLMLYIALTVSAHADNKQSLFIVGSTSVGNLIDSISKPYFEQSGYQLVMRSIGSNKGLVSVAEGVSDVGVISRFLTPEEQRQYPQLVQVTIAQDAIVFIVNRQNPTANLSTQDIVSIYTDDVPSWPNLNKQVYLMTKNLGHGTHDSFLAYFGLESIKSSNNLGISFKKTGINHLYSRKVAIPYSRINQAVANVFRNKAAIAFESLGAYQKFIATQDHVRTKLLAINGVESLIDGKANPNYPVKRPLNFLINKERDQSVDDLIKFLQSPVGTALIEKNNYIALKQ